MIQKWAESNGFLPSEDGKSFIKSDGVLVFIVRETDSFFKKKDVQLLTGFLDLPSDYQSSLAKGLYEISIEPAYTITHYNLTRKLLEKPSDLDALLPLCSTESLKQYLLDKFKDKFKPTDPGAMMLMWLAPEQRNNLWSKIQPFKAPVKPSDYTELYEEVLRTLELMFGLSSNRNEIQNESAQ